MYKKLLTTSVVSVGLLVGAPLTATAADKAEVDARIYATDRDPDLAWGWHGLAVSEANIGASWLVTEAYARRALDDVESLSDALVLTRARVAILAAAGEHERAGDLARAMAAFPLLGASERASFEALSLTMDLRRGGMSIDLSGGSVSFSNGDGEDTGGERLRAALALLAPGAGLADHDAVPLAQAILYAPYSGRTRTELLHLLVAAFEARRVEDQGGVHVIHPLGPYAEGLRRELDELSLAQALVPGPSAPVPLDHADRLAAARFRAGDLAGWLDAWYASLPTRVRALVPVLELSGEDGTADAAQLAAFLERLGWYDAALALQARSRATERLGELEQGDPLGPFELSGGGFHDSHELRAAIVRDHQQRDLAARASLLAETERVFDRRFEDGDLADLLEDLEALVRETAGTGHGVVADGIAASPLDTYGPFARLVTPLTSDDEPSPGLQAMLAHLGRVAIVGEQFGTLDGTVRPLVTVEPIEGDHLGAPYSGTILWCSGVDVRSRAERAGAQLAGAAVHDGYWIDLEVVRAGAEGWRQRARDLRPGPRWYGDEADDVPRAPEVLGGHLATRRVPLLNEADRLAVVLLAERGGQPPSLDELLEVITVHEEGHLCDRARFLPLGEKWGAGLRFFASCGFNPDVMMRRLEYRAQLVALAVVPDPRLVLWEVLEQAEATEARGGGGVTPHGSAYVELLNDLVALVAERGPAEVGLDPARYLRWQLHRLDPDTLLELAKELARREGLTG